MVMRQVSGRNALIYANDRPLTTESWAIIRNESSECFHGDCAFVVADGENLRETTHLQIRERNFEE
jgi:hypothetical protein